jgi:hypothetical protein
MDTSFVQRGDPVGLKRATRTARSARVVSATADTAAPARTSRRESAGWKRCCWVKPPDESGEWRSAEFLGEPDQKSFGTTDVAEPIQVFVLHHLADELRAVLAEPGERIVEVVHSEHDA